MKFSDTIGSTTRLSNFRTFGCSVYILDARLQSVGGGGPTKWDPRYRLGIYLGHSPSHAGIIALVMNTKYGLVSPKFYSVLMKIPKQYPSLGWNCSRELEIIRCQFKRK